MNYGISLFNDLDCGDQYFCCRVFFVDSADEDKCKQPQWCPFKICCNSCEERLFSLLYHYNPAFTVDVIKNMFERIGLNLFFFNLIYFADTNMCI